MIDSYAKLDAMAREYGGTSKEFSQGTWMTRVCTDFTKLMEVRNGICRALSAAYLVRNYTRSAKGDFDFLDTIEDDVIRRFGPKNFFTAFDSQKLSGNQGDADKRRFDKMYTAQTKFRQDGALTRDDVVRAAEDTVKALSNGLMRRTNDWSVLHFGRGVEVGTIQSPGFWYLSAGKHGMAAVCRQVVHDDFGFPLPKTKFFDPNYGQVVFHGANAGGSLATFMTKYFERQDYGQVEMIQFA